MKYIIHDHTTIPIRRPSRSAIQAALAAGMYDAVDDCEDDYEDEDEDLCGCSDPGCPCDGPKRDCAP